LALAVLVPLLVGRGAAAATVVLDDFETLSGWTAITSEGTRAWITHEPGRTGMGMRIGFDLNSGGGWVIVRKQFSLALPENYAFTFDLRGDGRPNNFEFKLVDARERSVWWRNQRDFTFPREWQHVTIRKSRIDLAWGPSGARLAQVGAIEFAIAAGEGGSGAVGIDDLAFEEREPAAHDGVVPEVQASTSLAGHPPASALDQDGGTRWMSEPLPRAQWLVVDFRRNTEHGGLVIDWDPEDWATAFEVQVSNDGAQWTTAYRTVTGRGGRDYVYMPDAESRYVRVDLQRSSRGRGYGIAGLVVKPFEFSASPNRFFEAIARDGAVGMYPKYFYGRQTYWTVVGVDGDDKEALLNEEGMLEVDKGAFSIEPFLYTEAGLLTWNDVATAQELADGYLPIPTVTWRRERVGLATTVFAAGGEPGRSVLYARYRVENRGARSEPLQLFLAIRPFQVNPPWQTLNTTGGVTTIQELRFDGRSVWVNGDRPVVSLTPPDRFGAATFEEGAITKFLAGGKVPSQTLVSDPFGFASGALQYNFYLEPGAGAEVELAVPFHEPQLGALGLGAGADPSLVGRRLDETRHAWERTLGRVEIGLPPDAEEIARSVKTQLAYTLINRDPPALRPGSRNYARSWIRDGALTSAALLQMGFTQEVREFLRWFAGHQAADGKVPCCVDRRGADPVPEHDSAGAFIYAVAEHYRFTRDVGFLSELWPNVVGAVDYLAALRRRRMTEEFGAPDRRAFYGLLPESISHEGYAAHPVHSYWDDFFALKGLADAADLAVVVADEERAARFALLRDEFRATLYASIASTLARHGIDYIPGSVELGDFDPTSTAIALTPGGEAGNLPEPALTRTFERYYAEFRARRNGGASWEQYSPYEVRNAGALLRLGQRDRALDVLASLVADQRPAGWHQWAEVAWRDPAAPRFIGDMPHTWVGSGFIRSVRSLLAYEREADRALVVAAGVPAAWVTGGPGVTVKRLPTHHGVLSYRLRADGAGVVRLSLSGDLAVPPGKIVVPSPLPEPLRAVTVNGTPVETFTAAGAVIGECPAEVVLRY
jgi:hypothetical protein